MLRQNDLAAVDTRNKSVKSDLAGLRNIQQAFRDTYTHMQVWMAIHGYTGGWRVPWLPTCLYETIRELCDTCLTHVSMHTSMHMHTHVYMHVYTHTYTCVYTHTYTCVYLHYTHVYARIYTLVYIHIAVRCRDSKQVGQVRSLAGAAQHRLGPAEYVSIHVPGAGEACTCAATADRQERP